MSIDWLLPLTSQFSGFCWPQIQRSFRKMEQLGVHTFLVEVRHWIYQTTLGQWLVLSVYTVKWVHTQENHSWRSYFNCETWMVPIVSWSLSLGIRETSTARKHNSGTVLSLLCCCFLFYSELCLLITISQ